ncbi:Protein-S-isoprenylcysteine methyltransferase [Hyella patelloides LEGE 07179]|uniref:Protein-S-isoprenylcysteine methyltransferase n=1 Tax=Hyella patelloides LEGE 07179 TaxID=945734 RepID=A0A563W420_9CYAN|nr:isoprenylcysteine carboxylmethyltransferase family protein [Hyella patelloides]VEP18416.1 Protein-S-isoprenylcysteine methyltransferase [Hyella patelloides LEGE 07179]
MRFAKIFLSLLCVICLLIILPAYIFDRLSNWQVYFLAISYLLFFLATVWRTTKLGNLAKRSEDKQVKSRLGRAASFVGIFGLIGVHWLAIYESTNFSDNNFYVTNIVFTIIGTTLVFSAIIVNQVAVKTLGKFFDRLVIKDQHQLITSGIYSQIRHPIYTSYLLLFISFCTLLQSWFSLEFLAVVCFIWFGNRITIEEEMLTQEFGENYQTYQQETKRLLPLIY